MGKRGNGEGSIYRRKDGRWVGQYTAQTATGQKRRYVYAKTRAEVAAKLAKAIANRDAGVTFDAGNLTVADYLTTWLNDGVRGTVRPSTYRRYEQLCRGHIVPALGNLQLTALSPAHVQRFYRAKLDAGLRGCADRQVANVSMGDEKLIWSFGEPTNMKSSEPIRASS